MTSGVLRFIAHELNVARAAETKTPESAHEKMGTVTIKTIKNKIGTVLLQIRSAPGAEATGAVTIFPIFSMFDRLNTSFFFIRESIESKSAEKGLLRERAGNGCLNFYKYQQHIGLYNFIGGKNPRNR